MAINFPPYNNGDPEPQDGDTFLYAPTQAEFECHRIGTETPQWAEKGVINKTQFGYRGGLNIVDPAPGDAFKGNLYSVLDGGFANQSFTGLGGTEINQYALIIFEDPNWVTVDTGSNENIVTGPWIRTSNGQIQPAVATDDLNMNQGDYLIDQLPEL